MRDVSPDRVWERWVDAEADGIRTAGQWREPRSFDAAGPNGRLTATGQDVVSFASNDYLGLSQHPALKAAAIAAVERWGTGAGASRHVVGSRPVHHDLEAAIAGWRGTEAAAVFPTGYAANLGVLATLGRPGVRIHSDELNHASIVDGCRMARANGAELRVHRHLDLDQLAAGLAEPGADRQVVVMDSVFSMDGDVAPRRRPDRAVRPPRRPPGARRGPRRAPGRPAHVGRRRRSRCRSAPSRRPSAPSAASSPGPGPRSSCW